MNSLKDNNFYDMDFEPVEKKITELSRQLKTYLNYRESTILAICGDRKNALNINKIGSIQKWERDLYESNLEYTYFLKKNIGDKENFKMKFLFLAKKALSVPNSQEAKSFKNFLKNKIRLWNLLHILSGLEIHRRPQLLMSVLTILTKLCNDEEKLNENFPEFFQQLKLNYRQLKREYEEIIIMTENKKFKSKTKKEKVRIQE